VNWEEKKEVKKGEIGEIIVRKYLENKGYIVYQPKTKGAHYFDMLCTLNKNEVIALDVKTKARLNYYEATGIELRHYEDYKRLINTIEIPFYLYFVDEMEGKVYRQLLNDLPSPWHLNKTIVCWDLKDLNYLFSLNEKEKKELQKLNTRSYKYKPV
tara:strand:- start:198 stop:665 length:468 start_codon:yes stop_codon:yes gene_type:complete